MEDWAKRIDAYLSSDERPLLDNAGSVSHEEAVLCMQHIITVEGRSLIRTFLAGATKGAAVCLVSGEHSSSGCSL